MSVSNGYATLAELRANLTFGAANTASDTQLEGLLETGSRALENVCHRRFYGKAETRYYTAEDGYEIQVDDFTSVSALKTDDNGDGTFETTWTTAAYSLKYGNNYNAALDGKPYTQIEATESGGLTFPVAIRKGVLVSGVCGYSAGTASSTACPKPIHDATLLLAERVYKRKDTPLGFAGNPALGQQTIRVTDVLSDPDIMFLIGTYIKQV
jgi:hypothetical protein